MKGFRTILLLLILPVLSPQLSTAQPHGAPASQITLSVDVLPDFREVYVNTVSDVQFYDVYVYPVTTQLVIEAEYPFKISLSCYDDFTTTISLTPQAGTIDQRIFVRAFPESTGVFTPSITHTSSSAGIRDLPGSITAILTGIPDGYYSTATGVGSNLKTQLHQIIKDHTVLSYNSLWGHFEITDATFAGFVWDIYSDTPCSEPPYIYVFGDDQDTGSGGNQEGEVFNREHSMPRSWFGGAVNPMNTDMYHIYPVDKHVNAVRDNWPFGMVDHPQWTSLNGGKLGPNTAGDTYSDIAFEPIDEYKGDLARTFLYMVTRYEDRIENWTFSDEGNNMFDHNTYPGYQPWVIDMLLEWHHSDPVSQRERLRNDAIYQLQGNRNPFVDHPHFVERIWGDTTAVFVHPLQELQIMMYPNPAGKYFSFHAPFTVESLEVYCLHGRRLMIIQPLENSGRADISSLAPGVYVVRFSGNREFISKPLLVY